MKIIDLFSGAGGLSLGFEKAGFEPVLAIDFWNRAIETYNHNHKFKVGVHIDIRNVDENYLKEKLGNQFYEIDGVIGGPPCQGFSIAGQRIIDDERNALYRDYFRIVELLKPKFFVIENVPGILSLSKGVIKEDIHLRASSLGYNVKEAILNAANHGVPQYRKRVFFVAFRNDFDISKFSFPELKETEITIFDALSDLPLLESGHNTHDYRFEPQNNYQRYLRGDSKVVLNHVLANHTQMIKDIISLVKEGQGLNSLPDEFRKGRNYSSLLRRMDRNKPSFTIDTGHRTYFHFSENRIPSVREAARIQSFPDYFEFLGGRQDQYKQVGNAVPPILANEIANSIIKVLYK